MRKRLERVLDPLGIPYAMFMGLLQNEGLDVVSVKRGRSRKDAVCIAELKAAIPDDPFIIPCHQQDMECYCCTSHRPAHRIDCAWLLASSWKKEMR